jgi:hypothetical protein
MNKEIVNQEQLEAQIQETIKQHQDIVVSDDAGYIAAQEALKLVKSRQKEVEAWFKPLVEKAHAAHKELTSKRKQALDPLKVCYNNISGKVSKYSAEKEAEARRERERQEAELKRQQEEQQLADAEALQDAGKTEEAEQVLSQPVSVAPVPLQTAPKVDNVSYRENWHFDIQDQSKIPNVFMTPDTKKIGQYVRAMKGSASIPGVRIYVEKKPVVR